MRGDGMKKKLVGIGLIVIAVLIAILAGYQYLKSDEKKESMEKPISQEKIDEPSSNVQEPEPDQEQDEFQVIIPNDYLELLELNVEEVRELVETWTRENQDYGVAIGVEFLECNISSIEEKDSFVMQTLVGEESYEEESRILILDYEKDRGTYRIHP